MTDSPARAESDRISWTNSNSSRNSRATQYAASALNPQTLYFKPRAAERARLLGNATAPQVQTTGALISDVSRNQSALARQVTDSGSTQQLAAMRYAEKDAEIQTVGSVPPEFLSRDYGDLSDSEDTDYEDEDRAVTESFSRATRGTGRGRGRGRGH